MEVEQALDDDDDEEVLDVGSTSTSRLSKK